jgi:hypothetical protein
MLEMMMRSFDAHFEPTILLEQLDQFPAIGFYAHPRLLVSI